MANLFSRVQQRSNFGAITLDQWTSFFDYGGLSYPFNFQQTISGHVENADATFEGLVQSAFKSNGVIFACMIARQLLFSEARFAFRRYVNARPGDLFGGAELAILEHPWPNGVTADLLSRAIQDVDLAGNFFAVRRPNRIRRLRPDWVTIILGSHDDPSIQAGDIDAEVVGYLYHPGGRGSDREPVYLLPEEVSHFAPIPDPAASYRGMSWIIPVMREFLSDSAMIIHKKQFFENGATPNMVVTLDPSIKKDAFKEWVSMFNEKHEGALNAYKTLYLGAGSTMTPVGKDFKQMDFAITQAAGETRIAAAAGVPPVIVGLSEGIKAATYSNYGQARRRFADMTMRPMWRSAATSFEALVRVPAGAHLWYDDRDIPFLFEDVKDRAAIQARDAVSIRQMIDAGFEPDAVIKAITSNDLSLLSGHHTGLYSVQLQPPLTAADKAASAAADAKTASQPPVPTPPKTPAPAPTKKSSREEALEILRDMAAARATGPAPSVDVHFHEGAFRSGDQRVDIGETVLRLEDGAIRVESPVTIEDGAVRVDAPVTVERTEVHIDEGAVRSEVHVAPPELTLVDGAIRVASPVTFEPGAIRVDAPVTVERTEVHVDDGAVRVDARTTIEEGAVHAPVTVERTEVHIDEGAVRVESPVTISEGAVRVEAPVTVERTEVTVEPAQVTIAEGAIRSEVTVEPTEVVISERAVVVEAPITVEPTTVTISERAVVVEAPVTIEEGAVRVDAPVTVERTEVKIEPTTVTIAEGAVRVDAPVTLAEGAVRVDAPVTIERGAVDVQIDAPVQISEGAVRVDAPVTIERGAVEVQVDAPEVTVEAPKKRGRVVRDTEFRTDDDGKIVGKHEVETDEPQQDE